MTERLAEILTDALGGFPPLAVVFIISMIPKIIISIFLILFLC